MVASSAHNNSPAVLFETYGSYESITIVLIGEIGQLKSLFIFP